MEKCIDKYTFRDLAQAQVATVECTIHKAAFLKLGLDKSAMSESALKEIARDDLEPIKILTRKNLVSILRPGRDYFRQELLSSG